MCAAGRAVVGEQVPRMEEEEADLAQCVAGSERLSVAVPEMLLMEEEVVASVERLSVARLWRLLLHGRRLGRQCCSRDRWGGRKEEEAVEEQASEPGPEVASGLQSAVEGAVRVEATAPRKVEEVEAARVLLAEAEELTEPLKMACGSLVAEVVSCLLAAGDLSWKQTKRGAGGHYEPSSSSWRWTGGKWVY